MVVQRTLDKIDELKERPHHERHAIALRGAVLVSGLLLIVWGFFTVRGVSKIAMELSAAQNALSNTPQAASAAAATTQSAPQPAMSLTASSTNGYVDLVSATQALNEGSN
jgi:hypothetical protein